MVITLEEVTSENEKLIRALLKKIEEAEEKLAEAIREAEESLKLAFSAAAFISKKSPTLEEAAKPWVALTKMADIVLKLLVDNKIDHFKSLTNLALDIRNESVERALFFRS